MSPTEKWAEKIAALLRKAEDPSIGQAEADAFFEKAQELMTRYSIDEAILTARAGVGERDEIIRVEIEYHSIYSRALYYVGRAIAVNNDCKVLIRKGKDLMRTTLVVIGYERDVRRVEMLNASVQIQCAAATLRFWNNYPDKWLFTTERERFKVRREFVFSYANGLDDKLSHARQSAVDTAEQDYDTSVALVLRDKAEIIEDWMTGNLTIKKGKRTKAFAGGDFHAQSQGYAAGQNANVNADPQVRTGFKEIER